MGMAKNQEAERKSSKAHSKFERKMRRIKAIEKHWGEQLPNLLHAVERGESQCLEVKLIIREGGEWMGIIKREGMPRNQVAFAFADSFFECLDGLNITLSQDKWRQEREWKPKSPPVEK